LNINPVVIHFKSGDRYAFFFGFINLNNPVSFHFMGTVLWREALHHGRS